MEKCISRHITTTIRMDAMQHPLNASVPPLLIQLRWLMHVRVRADTTMSILEC